MARKSTAKEKARVAITLMEPTKKEVTETMPAFKTLIEFEEV